MQVNGAPELSTTASTDLDQGETYDRSYLFAKGLGLDKREPMKQASVSAAALLCALVIASASQAQEAQTDRGRSFAQKNCAPCHAIGTTGESPLPKAPPFRTLHLYYPVEQLAESLAEGIKTTHPMPEFQLDSAQIADVIAYLKSLER
jgi:cytochrome c